MRRAAGAHLQHGAPDLGDTAFAKGGGFCEPDLPQGEQVSMEPYILEG